MIEPEDLSDEGVLVNSKREVAVINKILGTKYNYTGKPIIVSKHGGEELFISATRCKHDIMIPVKRINIKNITWSIEDVITHRYVIITKSHKEAKRIQKLLHSSGRKWRNNASYLDYDGWEHCGKKTFYFYPFDNSIYRKGRKPSHKYSLNSELVQ